jgi:hypothetical protein
MTFLDTPTDLWLAISPQDHAQSWQSAELAHNPRESWQRYLNHISLVTVLPWLQAETTAPATPWQDAAAICQDWLPGVAIALAPSSPQAKRLVLLPSHTLDTSELCIPQEWVDLPEWAGDYFWAIQVDPDELDLRVWGYASHQQVKQHSHYDPQERLYRLDAHHLVPDLSAFWVLRQLQPQEPTQAAISPVPALSGSQAQALIAQLIEANPIALRQRLPFEQWAALLKNPNLCQQLAQQRSSPALELTLASTDASPEPLFGRLQTWLSNQLETGWHTLESVLGDDPSLAYGMRRVAADLSETAVRRVKRVKAPDQELLLVVEVEPEPDDRLGIRIQLRPLDATGVLPADLRMALLTGDGDLIQQVQTRDHDNLIQFKRFRCPFGTEFSLHIAIANRVVTGRFIV